MKRTGLQENISSYVETFKSFESLLKARKKLPVGDDHLATALCGLHAAKGAYHIRAGIRSCVDVEPGFSCNGDENIQGMLAGFPTYEAVHGAARELLSAVSSKDSVGIVHTLRKMGVLSFCPKPDPPFPSMEQFALSVSVRAQVIFLVELSLFAVDVGEYEQASRYVQRARTRNPRSLELYNVCMVEGLIALNAGRVHDAARCLAGSLEACLENADTATECSTVAPNFELVEKLLEHGEVVEVLRHLSDCLDLWVRFKTEVLEWMDAIERGGLTDFHCPGPVKDASRPSWKLRVQWLRACLLEAELYSTSFGARMSRAEVLAARDRLLARSAARSDAIVRKRIEYLEDGSDSKR
jgi:hypothetical protein